MAAPAESTPLARALGRVPTGLYIVSTRTGDGPLGYVGSFLVQCGLRPPMICTAVGHDRPALAAIRACGRFAVSILDGKTTRFMGAFFRSYPPGKTAFDEVACRTTPSGLTVLATGLAWLDCRLAGEHDAGDHVVLFGEVERGELVREGDPAVHLRKNGLDY
jgi:flavin reductase (DIM6/NTAB) family NADH-FMN oxidoreductase RutF